jgi:hypothetical protein
VPTQAYEMKEFFGNSFSCDPGYLLRKFRDDDLSACRETEAELSARLRDPGAYTHL